MLYSRKKKDSSANPEIPADYITCEYDREIARTNKAVLIDFGDTETWLPLSQVILWKENGENRISMKPYLYQSKGL